MHDFLFFIFFTLMVWIHFFSFLKVIVWFDLLMIWDGKCIQIVHELIDWTRYSINLAFCKGGTLH